MTGEKVSGVLALSGAFLFFNSSASYLKPLTHIRFYLYLATREDSE